MDQRKVDLLRDILESGIGAEVVVEPYSPGMRSGLRSWFRGLTPNQGPCFSIVPNGLRRQQVRVAFGTFANECVAQMQAADAERLSVSRALIEQIGTEHGLKFSPEQDPGNWILTGADFELTITARDIADPTSDEAITATAERIMVPLMAAMAELIGYDEAEPFDDQYDEEGKVTYSTVKRRERSPRNRLLCLSIHGHRCAACGLAPDDRYGAAGKIIEVHHLEPVSNLEAPRPYDPRTELIPLCPNCHSAVHTRRPVPYTLDELKGLLADDV